MLQNKYKFKHGNQSVTLLLKSLVGSMEEHRHTQSGVTALALLALKPLTARLQNKLMAGDPIKSITIKRIEAIALHIAYKKNYIDNQHFLIQEIFTAIDKTL